MVGWCACVWLFFVFFFFCRVVLLVGVCGACLCVLLVGGMFAWVVQLLLLCVLCALFVVWLVDWLVRVLVYCCVFDVCVCSLLVRVVWFVRSVGLSVGWLVSLFDCRCCSCCGLFDLLLVGLRSVFCVIGRFVGVLGGWCAFVLCFF